jgi:hypothetical protein
VAATPHWRLIVAAPSGVNLPLTKTTKLPLFFNRLAVVWTNECRHPQRFSRQRKTDSRRITIMTELTGKVGFASPITQQAFSKRRSAGVELIATVALAVSLIIAATAVSLGVARAQAFRTASDGDGAPLAVAVFLGAVMAGMGGLTAMAARGPGSDVAELGPNSDRSKRQSPTNRP